MYSVDDWSCMDGMNDGRCVHGMNDWDAVIIISMRENLEHSKDTLTL